MDRKNKKFLDAVNRIGKGIGNATIKTGKFFKDAVLTEFVHKEFKPSLGDYNPSETYVDSIRAPLKLFGSGLIGAGGILGHVLTNNPDYSIAGVTLFVLGWMDSFYDQFDSQTEGFEARAKKQPYFPPAIAPLETLHTLGPAIRDEFKYAIGRIGEISQQLPPPEIEDNGYSNKIGNYGLIPPKFKYRD